MESSELSAQHSARLFFYLAAILIPLIVGIGTFAFYPFVDDWLWLPLILLYWITIWSATFIYHRKFGNVFKSGWLEPTLKLRGDKVWIQYLLLYGNLVYAVPLYFVNYFSHLSGKMLLVLFLVSFINGPSEEIFWRGCMESAGERAGFSPQKRLVLAPILFSLWHTAFVLHLYPWNDSWFMGWALILVTTWLSGVIWLVVLQKSQRLFPQMVMHSVANFFSVFPMLLITVMGLYF
jgi:hypothetical protein